MIKTTRLKTVQVPMNRTYDLSNQCDGVTQVFHLPVRVEKLDSHYVIFNGQIYKNDRNHTFYKISADGTTLTTFFDYAPMPGKNRALQFVKTEASEGQPPFATEEFVTNALSVETSERIAADDALRERINFLSIELDEEIAARTAADQAEAQIRETTDNELLAKINTIEASSDVKDIVGTKAELDAYDTSTLFDNDIIKVLQDESEDNASTYYRWHTDTSTFTLIGRMGPYYTEAETNSLLNEKADKADTYTKTEVDDLVNSKVFVAVYQATTAQELIEYIDSSNEPFAPIVIKNGNQYYPVILAFQQSADQVYLRTVGTISGKYHFFNYTVKNGVWSVEVIGIQKTLVSGTDIKTVNGESILGSGNINTDTDLTNYYTKDEVYNKTEMDDALALKADVADIPDISGLATKEEVIEGLALKANITDLPDMDNYYDKTSVDGLLGGKADKVDVYTKDEVDALIPDVSDFVTSQELADGLDLKADKATTYTKDETDALLDEKQDKLYNINNEDWSSLWQ